MAGAERYGESGAITWAEVNTREPSATDTFYRRLFGFRVMAWQDIPQEYPVDAPAQQTGMDYVVYTTADGAMLCGRITMTADFGDAPRSG
jgi:uncharacterized protein